MAYNAFFENGKKKNFLSASEEINRLSSDSQLSAEEVSQLTDLELQDLLTSTKNKLETCKGLLKNAEALLEDVDPLEPEHEELLKSLKDQENKVEKLGTQCTLLEDRLSKQPSVSSPNT